MKGTYSMKKLIIVLLAMALLSGAQGIHAEGILPSKTEIDGTGLPSLGEALQRYPKSETENGDGSVTELYMYVMDRDYETFSVYLSAQGTVLKDYRIEDGILTAELQVGDASFSFSYDSDNCEAKVTYPAGTYDEWIRKSRMLFASAQKDLEEGNTGEAASDILRIPQYRDFVPVKGLLQENPDVEAAVEAHEEKLAPFREIGSTVTFGRYEQDPAQEGMEPIEWIVLDYDGRENKALLITRYGLEYLQFSENPKATYGTSSLRDWVTGNFISTAFTAKEQEAILTTEVDNSAAQGYAPNNPADESNTQDKAFILSYAEARQYLGIGPTVNPGAATMPTAYLLSDEFGNNGQEKSAAWWLRSPGGTRSEWSNVDGEGLFDPKYRRAAKGWTLLARPAIWLDLNADF